MARFQARGGEARRAEAAARYHGPQAGEIFWDKLPLSMVLYEVDKLPPFFSLTRLDLL